MEMSVGNFPGEMGGRILYVERNLHGEILRRGKEFFVKVRQITRHYFKTIRN